MAWNLFSKDGKIVKSESTFRIFTLSAAWSMDLRGTREDAEKQ